MKEKVYLFCYGCSNLKVDGNIYAEYLKANNFEITDDIRDAERIVFLGCGVVQEFEDNSIRFINEFVQEAEKRDIPVYVGGCIVRIADEIINGIQGKFEIIDDFEGFEACFPSECRLYDVDYGDKNHPIAATPKRVLINRLVDIEGKVKARDRIRAIDSKYQTDFSFYHEYLTDVPYSEEMESVYNIVVSRGCAFCCSYCVIRIGRGQYKSRRIEDILIDFKRGYDKGYKKFNLVAEENGNYGIDIPGGKTTVITLLTALCEYEGDYSFALKYVHPVPFLKYFEQIKDFIKRKRIYYLCVPIQTGSQNLLKKMNRHYDPWKVGEKINQLRAIDRSLLIITHVMSGFPGETEDDHKATLALVAETEFDQVLSHGYSARAKAPSSGMTQNVSEAEIKKRVEDIRRCNKQVRKAALTKHFSRICNKISDPNVRADVLSELVELLER